MPNTSNPNTANLFRRFVKNQKEQGLGTITTEDLQAEVTRREMVDNPFPLDVFHSQAKPYISALNKEYDIPESFIGLGMLCAYSTAIGTAYAVSTNGDDLIYLPVWGCFLGISSSGKSLALNKIFAPLQGIQQELDDQRLETITGMTYEKAKEVPLRMVLYRDAHVPTLVRYIINDNPKGVAKISDELLEWINGMNQLSAKEGTDEQFWLSTWNCQSYSAVRSGRDRIILHRPFVNVVGGTQYSMLPKLFGKDRDSTGFIFRLLFAKPITDRVAMPNPSFSMPAEFATRHGNILRLLYNQLRVEFSGDRPSVCILSQGAKAKYQTWSKDHAQRINRLEDAMAQEVEAGILGKIKEYALRFAAILHITDLAYSQNWTSEPEAWVVNQVFGSEMLIHDSTMERAIRLANYFYQSAREVSAYVRRNLVAPEEVLQAAALIKMGYSRRDIARILYKKTDDATVKRVQRDINKWINQYPRVFNAESK